MIDKKTKLYKDIAELITWQGWAPLASFLPAVMSWLMVND